MDSLVLSTGVWQDILVYGFRTLFFLSAILLMVIVLLQEGKGGGLASALGGQGAETFGVSSGGVNRVTLFLAGLFLVSALGHSLAFEQGVTTRLRRESQDQGVDKDDPLEDIGTEGDEQGGDEGMEPPPGGGSKPADGTKPADEKAKAPPPPAGGETKQPLEKAPPAGEEKPK